MSNIEEFEIARKFGGSHYLVYKVIKSVGRVTKRDIQFETGLHERTLKDIIRNLRAYGLVDVHEVEARHGTKRYITTEKVLH